MLILEFNIDIFTIYLPFILLYTEVHFKIKCFGSRYFKCEPEILSDIPIRIEPGRQLPVLILVKDANIYPIKLISVDINIYKSKNIVKAQHKKYCKNITTLWWWDTILVDLTNIKNQVYVDVIIMYQIKTKKQLCHIHSNCSLSFLPKIFRFFFFPPFSFWYLPSFSYSLQ